MSLSRAEVEKVSLLARLSLSEAEIDRLARQLGGVLEYIALLGEVDTTHVAPLAHPLELQNVFRDDCPRDSLPCEQAMANAPAHDGQCYLVPAVLGDA